MKRLFTRLALGCFIMTVAVSANAQTSYGGALTQFDPSLIDPRYQDEMEQWATAGVPGGIPNITHIKAILNPGDDIQSAINNGGAGVVFLKNGNYSVNSTINLRSNVVLRGESRTGVVIKSKVTALSYSSKGNTINIGNTVQSAGIENLTILYDLHSYDPVDRDGLSGSGWCGPCFENNTANDFVRQINILGVKNWVLDVDILKSGTDPIQIGTNAHYNTIKNVFVDRCYNKGGGGNGYFDLRGDYNLITGCTVKRIRHFSIQQGAKYNVVIDNHFEVDVNFHNGDNGYNLVEANKIYKPSWHGWDVFAAGTSVHADPGPYNHIFKNDGRSYNSNGSYTRKWADPDVIYTHNLKQLVATEWPVPEHGTFYAVINDPGVPTVNIVSPSHNEQFGANETVNIEVQASDEDGTIVEVALYVNGQLESTETASNHTWVLSDLSFGVHQLTVVATDNDAKTVTKTISVEVGNIGLNATILDFSGYQNEPTINEVHPPENLIDGDLGTRWSVKNISEGHFAEIDLGDVYDISQYALVCFLDRAYQFTIKAKQNEGDAYGPAVVDQSANQQGGSESNPVSEKDLDITARYIRLDVTGLYDNTSAWVSLLELKLYGVLSNITGMKEHPHSKITFYPNPFDTDLKVVLGQNHGFSKVQLFSSSGQLICSKMISSDGELDLLDGDVALESGLYFIHLTGAAGTKVLKVLRR